VYNLSNKDEAALNALLHDLGYQTSILIANKLEEEVLDSIDENGTEN
jgi:hypothetical protein